MVGTDLPDLTVTEEAPAEMRTPANLWSPTHHSALAKGSVDPRDPLAPEDLPATPVKMDLQARMASPVNPAKVDPKDLPVETETPEAKVPEDLPETSSPDPLATPVLLANPVNLVNPVNPDLLVATETPADPDQRDLPEMLPTAAATAPTVNPASPATPETLDPTALATTALPPVSPPGIKAGRTSNIDQRTVATTLTTTLDTVNQSINQYTMGIFILINCHNFVH